MSDQASPRYIKGTEGKVDYIVVGSKDGMILAVKAIADTAMPAAPVCQMGVRVRSTADDDVTVANIPHSVQSAYPDVEWTKGVDTHCSVAWAMKGPAPSSKSEALEIVREKVMPVVMAKLNEQIEPLCNEVSYADLKAWLTAQFDMKLGEWYGETPATDGEPANPAEVIDFADKKAEAEENGSFFADPDSGKH